MTNTQINTQIKKAQKQVNTLLKMNLEGDVTINIEIKAKDYTSFEIIQNRIEEEVIIERSNLKIGLFFIWKK